MMPYIDVTVDVELDAFDDQDLIDELEGRGWVVGDEKDKTPLTFDDEELDFIYEMTKDSKPGTPGYEIYLKVRKGAR
jgi:hypothetical protein